MAKPDRRSDAPEVAMEAVHGVPVIDVGPLLDPSADPGPVAAELDRACRDVGFFVAVGHGVPRSRLDDLLTAARVFFALGEEEKAEIAMHRAGRAWRGWFPLGGELTSGVPDGKEGIYFGEELPPSDRLLHGPNLFPERPAELRTAVLAWLDAMTGLGHALMGGLSLGLGMERSWIDRCLTADPITLFRIFRYPPVDRSSPDRWGVAEHTDYGLLTILADDGTPGLEVRTRDGWVSVDPVEGGFVCNLGDMLERMTAGRYRSTPHRVRPPVGGPDRLSCPFFFDPGWDVEVGPLPLDGAAPADDPSDRWDHASVHDLSGTYGEYLTAKVAKVFPYLM
jgi:isopenicillin N synthase-like dioxygenase